MTDHDDHGTCIKTGTREDFLSYYYYYYFYAYDTIIKFLFNAQIDMYKRSGGMRTQVVAIRKLSPGHNPDPHKE